MCIYSIRGGQMALIINYSCLALWANLSKPVYISNLKLFLSTDTSNFQNSVNKITFIKFWTPRAVTQLHTASESAVCTFYCCSEFKFITDAAWLRHSNLVEEKGGRISEW